MPLHIRRIRMEKNEDYERILSTYYGENYGHSGQFEDLLTIGNTCLPALHGKGARAGQTSPR